MSPRELADAFWEQYQAGDTEDSPYSWAWELADAIARGETWDDWFAAEWEDRPPRVAPEIDRLEFVELLAATAPGGPESLGYLGAGPLESYLETNPDVSRVDAAAVRSKRFSFALSTAWYDSKLPPEDVARLRRFGEN